MSAPSVESSTLIVTNELVRSLVTMGGYVHPLFTLAESDTGGPPLPGEAVLLLMGGLVEQAGVADDAVAMLEMKSARFSSMLRAGSTLRVLVSVAQERVTAGGSVLRNYLWTALDADELVAEVEVVMLMSRRNEEVAP
jgi:acyl dehydratase